MTALDRRFCVAPMLDWTDRHCRYLLRLIFPQALLYTEMLTTDALIHGSHRQLLNYDPAEHPVAVQLGGHKPSLMAHCAKLAAAWGYDEINMNVGCPSDRVQAGRFGACLMAEPDTVADCVAAMCDAVNIPVTVKTRIGIDDLDSVEHLHWFVESVAAAGCRVFIIHARKAWLQGLSPKENREIPPLDYQRVYDLKKQFPQLSIIINGGITTTEQAISHLQQVDGVMLGRAAYQSPFQLIDIQERIFGVKQADIPDRIAIIRQYMHYIEQQLRQGVYLKHITRHMLGLFQGMPGAKQWRRTLTQYSVSPDAGLEVIEQALTTVS